MQKQEEAGVGSAVGLARSDLKLVGGSQRDRGPKGRLFGVSGTTGLGTPAGASRGIVMGESKMYD